MSKESKKFTCRSCTEPCFQPQCIVWQGFKDKLMGHTKLSEKEADNMVREGIKQAKQRCSGACKNDLNDRA